MTLDRKGMERALKSIVVPRLRSLRFVGTFPYFRRKVGDEAQMVMIKFNKYGGSFYLEAGRMSQHFFEHLQAHWARAGKALEESDLNVGHCKSDERSRLGPDNSVLNSDHWFDFSSERADAAQIAEKVANVVDTQLEAFFSRGG